MFMLIYNLTLKHILEIRSGFQNLKQAASLTNMLQG